MGDLFFDLIDTTPNVNVLPFGRTRDAAHFGRAHCWNGLSPARFRGLRWDHVQG
jgi:hypothetical protein